MQESEIRKELNNLDNRVDTIEKQIPVINERYNNTSDLIQKNIAVLDKLENSFQDNRLAMQAMTTSIEQSSKEISNLKKDVNSLKDERNFNIMSWLKSNFLNVVTIVGILYWYFKIAIW